MPDYIAGPDYGGGVYVTIKGGFNPVLWNGRVGERFDTLIAALGREFDRDPNLEAVSHPERSVYRLYAKMAGHVPRGAAAQSENYTVA